MGDHTGEFLMVIAHRNRKHLIRDVEKAMKDGWEIISIIYDTESTETTAYLQNPRLRR